MQILTSLLSRNSRLWSLSSVTRRDAEDPRPLVPESVAQSAGFEVFRNTFVIISVVRPGTLLRAHYSIFEYVYSFILFYMYIKNIYTRILGPPKAGHENQRKISICFELERFENVDLYFGIFVYFLKMCFCVLCVSFWAIYLYFECFYEFRCHFLYI